MHHYRAELFRHTRNWYTTINEILLKLGQEPVLLKQDTTKDKWRYIYGASDIWTILLCPSMVIADVWRSWPLITLLWRACGLQHRIKFHVSLFNKSFCWDSPDTLQGYILKQVKMASYQDLTIKNYHYLVDNHLQDYSVTTQRTIINIFTIVRTSIAEISIVFQCSFTVNINECRE